MKTINPETKLGKLYSALRNGDKVTAAQAQKRFGIKNVRAEATRIRQRGYVVNAENRKAGNGVVVTEYAIGRPTRELVAAGYRAIQYGLA